MPLSEHEQKIWLNSRIPFEARSPFREDVRETNVLLPRWAARALGILGFVVGLWSSYCSFRSPPSRLFAVALMFVSAVVIERNCPLLGRASWQDITRTPQGDDATRTWVRGPFASRLVVASAPQERMTGSGLRHRIPCLALDIGRPMSSALWSK